ncbi:tautomerase family protein [Hydrogenophaga sp. RWCD_12]|uniref:tautomerase family protein n=1 Tax=Hydrogenophaga sp. RWCD_12 TaxID=3391190 RepID=UPI00398518E4
MPLVTLTLRQRRPAVYKAAVLDAIHAALVQAGVPGTDRFQRVFTLDPSDAHIDPTYPDLARPRTDDALLIEILWSVGRSVKVKRALLTDLMQRLAALGIDTEQVMVVLQETAWENWSFGGGRQLHA